MIWRNSYHSAFTFLQKAKKVVYLFYNPRFAIAELHIGKRSYVTDLQSAKCNHVAKRNHTAKCKCKNSTKSSRSISCAMKKRRRKSFFAYFHLQRTLQRYHFATSETDDKSKTNVQMWSKNFHKAFWDTIFHKKNSYQPRKWWNHGSVQKLKRQY